MLTQKFKRSANEISAKAERPEGRDATKWASQTSYETSKEIVNSKPVMTRAAFDKLAPELKPYAFCISGVEDAQMLQDIRGIVADWTANPHGQHWADAKAEIAQKLSSLPNFSEEKARRRAELLLRTHGADAMRVGQWELAQQTKSFLPYFKYLCTQDGKTRPMHRKLHGLVLPIDHKFWDTHMPPGWDWGCRCQVVQISEAKMRKQREAEKRVPPENRRVLDEKQQELLAKNNELWLSPTEKLAITSSKNIPSCKSLYMNSDEILKKLDPDIREALLAKLEKLPVDGIEGVSNAKEWFLKGGKYSKSNPIESLGEIEYYNGIETLPKPDGKNFPITHNYTPFNLSARTKVGFVSAANIMYSVFDDGNLPECVIDDLLGSVADGHYIDGVISMNPNIPNPIETLIHESGHFLSDKVFKEDKEFEELIEILSDSETISELRKHIKSAYWTDRDEIWARAFTQYTLMKSNLLGKYKIPFAWDEKIFRKSLMPKIEKFLKGKKWRIKR